MPITRSTAVDGPSRQNPYTSGRSSRRQTSQISDVDSEPAPRRLPRRKTPISGRRLSAFGDEVVNGARRRLSSLSAPKRSYLRRSFGAEEMSVQARAVMLDQVSKDCLYKLLKGEGWEKHWDLVQSVRATYLFQDDSPPFPLLADVLEFLGPNNRSKFDITVLTRTLSLSNLTTFVYTIVRPDAAGDQLMNQDDDGNEDALSRRNKMLRTAWKEFWVVILPDGPGSRSALRIWLDFATQIYLVSHCPTIIPQSSPNKTSPRHGSSLFSPNAITRFRPGADLNADVPDLELEWKTLAESRLDELSQSSIKTMMRKYPYEAFQREMLAYIRTEVAHVQDIPQRTPTPRPSSVFRDTTSSDAQSDDERDVDATDHLEELQSTSDESEDGEGSEADARPVNIDALTQIALEMEREQTQSQTQSPRKRPRSQSETPNKDWAIRDRRSVTPKAPLQTGQRFNFAAYQPDAIQVAWDETQTQSRQTTPGPSTPKVRQEARFAPSSAALPSPIQYLGRTPGRTPLRTPGRTAGPTPSSNRMQQFLSADRGIARTLFAPESPSIGRSSHYTPVAPPRLASTTPLRRSLRPRSPSPDDFGDILPDTAQLNGVLPEPIGLFTSMSPEPGANTRQLTISGLGMPLETEESEFGRALGLGHSFDDEERTPPLIPDAPDILQLDAPEIIITEDFVREGSAHGLGVGMSGDERLDFEEELDSEELNVGLQEGSEIPREGNVIVPATLQQRQPSPTPALSAVTPNATRPTWQVAKVRPRAPLTPDDFAPLDPDDDEEDQLLLRPTPPPIEPGHSHEVKPDNGIPDAANSNRVRHLIQGAVGRSASRGRTFLPGDEDPYMVDENGSPLQEDETYVMDRDHRNFEYTIHGTVGDQKSIYSRKSGSRRWTKSEELLLYRTVQKVPLVEDYPLRVVWRLHGESGIESQLLEQFNPQHMKDKMRVIVQTRLNNLRVIEGRARFWLPKGHPDKLAYAVELERVKREMRDQEKEEADQERERRKAVAEAAAQKRKEAKERKALEDALNGDDDSDDDYREDTPPKDPSARQSRAVRRRRAREGDDAAEHESEENPDDAIQDDLPNTAPNAENEEGEPEIDASASEPGPKPKGKRGPTKKAKSKASGKGKTKNSNKGPEVVVEIPQRATRSRSKTAAKGPQIQSSPKEPSPLADGDVQELVAPTQTQADEVNMNTDEPATPTTGNIEPEDVKEPTTPEKRAVPDEDDPQQNVRRSGIRQRLYATAQVTYRAVRGTQK